MRIEFASGAHAPVTWSQGTLLLGSADGCDVRFAGRGISARHARLTADRRGLVLDVEPGAGRVYVNARPVRERALLRLGDVLGIGAERLRLVAEALAPADDVTTRASVAPVVALRAVAGPLSGRVWPITEPLALDATGPVESARNAALLRIKGAQVWLDAAALAEAVGVCVNGITTRGTVLRGGDQIAIGTHRFVLDASQCAPPVRAPADAVAAASAAAAGKPRRSGREMGWLIATAVVVALLLVWALLTHG